MSSDPHPTLRVFASHRRQAQLWMAFSLLSLLGYCAMSWHLVSKAYQTREYVVVGNNTIVVASPTEFGKAEELHHRQAVLATESLFNRHPGGFDHPERIDDLFLEEANKAARELLASEREEFAAKRIHQKVEIASVTLTEVRGRSVLVSVVGQLIRVGTFEGVIFTEAHDLKSHLVFRENLSISGTHPYPTQVIQFNYQTQPKTQP